MSPREEFVKAALNGLCASYTGNTLDAAFVADVAARAVAIADAAIKELDKPVEIDGDKPDVGEGWRELGPEDVLQEGDESAYRDNQREWLRLPTHRHGGHKYPSIIYRRRVTPVAAAHTVAPPPYVDDLHGQTKELRLVQDALSPMTFTALSIYHRNSASIRVRIVSNMFTHLAKGARIDLVDTYLNKLPPEIQQKILVLQLFTEEEARISPPEWPE